MTPKSVELAREIVKNFTGELVMYPMNERLARAVRNNVYDILTEQGKRGTMNLVIKNERLYVGAPVKSYNRKLEDMLRRVMIHIEDENLYDECLKLLEVPNG